MLEESQKTKEFQSLAEAFSNSELSDLKLKIVGDGQDLNKLKINSPHLILNSVEIYLIKIQ